MLACRRELGLRRGAATALGVTTLQVQVTARAANNRPSAAHLPLLHTT